MRLKVIFDKITNTVSIFEDDSGYALLALILILAVFMNAIMTFIYFVSFSVGLIFLAKKAKTRDCGAMRLAVGSTVLCFLYCVLIILCIVSGTGSSSFIFMLKILSAATVAYSINFASRSKIIIMQQAEGQDSVLAVKKCMDAKRIGVITLISILAFSVCLYVFHVPSPEETRAEKEQAKIEAQIAESVSVWDLNITQSDAIYGSSTKYDSYGNAYSGEYREFCAWNYPGGDVFEPHVVVDINEKYEYKRFTGTIFTRPDQDENLTITFKIFADGKCIYDSGEMRTSTGAIDLNLDVTGVDKLTFKAYTDFNDVTNPGVVLVNAFLHAE